MWRTAIAIAIIIRMRIIATVRKKIRLGKKTRLWWRIETILEKMSILSLPILLLLILADLWWIG